MKPFVLLVAVVCLSCGMAQEQETGRTLIPTLKQPEITYTQLKDLPHNQQGFTLTSSPYKTPLSRTSSQLTEEQKQAIKAQDDFRKSVALANEKHLKNQKESQIEQANVQDIGLDLPTHPSEPFRPSQPFDESIFHQAVPSPSAYVPGQASINFSQGLKVRQLGDAQVFNSQRVETFTPTETPQFFQMARPLPSFRKASEQQFVEEQRRVQEDQEFGRKQQRNFGQGVESFQVVRNQNKKPEEASLVQSRPQFVQKPQELGRKPQGNFGQGVESFQVVHNQNEKPEETFPSLAKPLVNTFKTAVEQQNPRLVISATPEETKPQTEEELFNEQAGNAKYSFQSSVADTINDNSHVRQETRDGLKLTGLYSYSDGFFKRTVHYVADENGYRVVREESEPIGTGPVHNPSGQVDVRTDLSGSSLQYTLKGDRIYMYGDRLPKPRTSSPVNKQARSN